KVSLTERLTKEQIMARMPHNLRTLEHLLGQNREDFKKLISKSTVPADASAARKRFFRRRRKNLTLVEELSLRTRRVQPMIRQLREMSRRMDAVRARLSAIQDHDANRIEERSALRKELRDLMLATLESPSSLRKRCATIERQFQEYEQVKRQL